MRFQYSFRLPVPVEQAWPVLLDLRRVAPCMPGAAIESVDGDDYVGRMKVKIGPIEMAYRGDLRFLERDDAARIVKVEGIGKEVRGGGGAKALVTMRAAADGAGSMISIDSEYSLSGKAAQFGTGMIDEIAGKLMKEFVARLERLLQAPAAPPRAPTAGMPIAGMGGAAHPARAAPAGADADFTATDDNEALDLVGLAWGPVLSRALPVVHFAVSVATLAYLIFWR
ncbi:hypothetical protein EIK56_13845 [Sphingomonas sp. C8-2]|jgi:carbon monoxide dehydrogenase subunit G|nr:hypothetical protein EIK56_13845 [Sphingomonas sp. C8-2]